MCFRDEKPSCDILLQHFFVYPHHIAVQNVLNLCACEMLSLKFIGEFMHLRAILYLKFAADTVKIRAKPKTFAAPYIEHMMRVRCHSRHAGTTVIRLI